MKHYQNTNQSSAENETHAGIIISLSSGYPKISIMKTSEMRTIY